MRNPFAPTKLGTGTFRTTYNIAGKKVGDAINFVNGSRGFAEVAGRHAADVVLNGLTKADKLTPEEADLFGRLVVDYQARAFDKKVDAQGNPIPHNIPKLTSEEYRDWNKFQLGITHAFSPADMRKWSKVAAAVVRHQTVVQPDLVGYRLMASPNMPLMDSPELKYNGKNVFVKLHNEDGTPLYQQTGSLKDRTVSKDTTSSRRRTGQGNYTTDYAENIKNDYTEVVPKAAIRNVWNSALSEGYAIDPADANNSQSPRFDSATNEFIPRIPLSAKSYGASPLSPVRVPIEKGGKELYVPRELQAAMELADSRPKMLTTGVQNALQNALSLSTRFYLASLSEAFGHYYRFMKWHSVLPTTTAALTDKTSSPLQKTGRVAASLTFPTVKALGDVWNTDMSHPLNQWILQDIYQSGSGSLRPFNDAMERMKIPGLQQLSDTTHHLLFGMAEGKGATGFDQRFAVMLEKLRRQLEPGTEDDMQRIRDFQNHFRQYQPNPDTIIQWARQIAPFSATSLPQQMARIVALTGNTGLKPTSKAVAAFARMESLFRFWAAPVLIAAAMGIVSGKKHPDAQGLDVSIGGDSNYEPRDIPENVAFPVQAGALRATGLKEPLDRYLHPESRRMGKDAATSAAADVANTVFQDFSSPLTASLLELFMGDALHVSPNRRGVDSLLKTVPRNPDGSRNFGWQAAHAASDALPLIGKPLEMATHGTEWRESVFGAEQPKPYGNMSMPMYKSIDGLMKILLGTGLK